MANKFRGEADLEFTREVDGETKPAKFKMVFDANALCEVEEVTGLDMGGFLESLSDPKKLKFSIIRAFVWASLLRNHEGLTLQDAGDIISDAGLDVVVAAMQKAAGGAMPAAKGGGEGEAKAKPDRGTGKKR